MSKTRLSADAELRVAVGSGVYLVACSNGAEVQTSAELAPAVRDDLLAGPGEGLLAHLQGAAVLHGSCVLYRGLGLSFVGPPGAGKSTLTAWFAAQGAELVSDGITLVDPDTRRLTRRRPQWRLRDDSLAFLGRRPDELPFGDPARYKRRLVAERSAKPSEDPILDVVFTLEEGDEVAVVEVSDMQKLIALVRDWYLASSLPATESPVLLDRSARLVRAGVRVARLVRPKQWSVFPAVAAALREYLRLPAPESGATDG